jgi:hypothetical protein
MIHSPASAGLFFIAYHLHTINRTKTHKTAQSAQAQEKEKALQIVDLQGFHVARPGGFEPSTF